MAKMGRPKIEIDWKQVEKMLYIQCTAEEIATILEISSDTLSRRCEEEHEKSFADYSATKRETGKMSMRRKFFTQAEKNPTLMIFWMKNHLGLRDKSEVQHTGGIRIVTVDDDDEQL